MKAASQVALRPCLPTDARAIVDIFLSSVEELTVDDYTEAQREAWMTAAEDEAAFVARVTKDLALLATIDGQPAGFSSLRGADHVEFLYVHPEHAGQGVATALYDALEKLAANRGATKLTVDASDTALEFFQRRGFVMKQRNSVHRSGEWLANTSLEKPLQAPAPQRRPQ